MALNIWTKSSGYNFASVAHSGPMYTAGNFEINQQYVIITPNDTDFTKIGARSNNPGTVFTATSTGSTAGPIVTQNGVQIETSGGGTASLVAFPERTQLNIPLPVTDADGVSYKVISGKLPDGLRLKNASIVGTPFEVPRITEFTFCIRATRDTEFSDRTFKITITGPDAPEFVTPEGDLPVGINNQYFCLDNAYVEYQIEAFDFDTAVGQHLSYYIADNDGELPPGLILTDDGRIVGFVKPVISMKPEDGTGFYDTGTYDSVAYDWGYVPSNGMDSYLYDAVVYDYSVADLGPRKLNRNYEFIVSVTDGDSIAKRKFKIFVVSDDYFRADNTIWLNGSGLFTADVTYLRAPIWVTSKYLGIYRANNYVTLVIDTYDTLNVVYRLSQVNSEIEATTHTSPDLFVSSAIVALENAGTTKWSVNDTFTIGEDDDTTDNFGWDIPAKFLVTSVEDGYITGLSIINPGVYTGYVGQTPPTLFYVTSATVADTNGYRKNTLLTVGFTSDSQSITENKPNSDILRIKSVSSVPQVGQFLTFQSLFNGGTEQIYEIMEVIPVGYLGQYRLRLNTNLGVTVPNDITFLIGTKSILPPGMTFDMVTAEVFGVVPYQPAITTSYNFTIVATRLDVRAEISSSYRTFKIDIIGEIDSILTWNTPSIIGPIDANYNSTLAISATSTITNDVVLYRVIGGRLPPGLTLNIDGEILGRVNQFSNNQQVGILTFDGVTNATTFDGNTTSFDHEYSFTAEATDQYGLSIITKTFTIVVTTPNQLVYSNLRVKPYMKLSQRDLWYEFINDPEIFTASSIYRPNDANFGIQTDLSMIVYAGIETKEAARFVSAIGLNHKRKRFQFGAVKTAVALKPGTYDKIYEVIYVEMVDPLEPDSKYLPDSILMSGQPCPITVDTSNDIWNVTSTNIGPTARRPDVIIDTDTTAYRVSDANYQTYYPNSVTKWRNRISQVGRHERNYLPLWMRSIQPNTRRELDFVLAIPLCYCKIGKSADIVLNIKYSDFDFSQLDYTVDRYIIDTVKYTVDDINYYSTDKYLIFRNDRITV